MLTETGKGPRQTHRTEERSASSFPREEGSCPPKSGLSPTWWWLLCKEEVRVLAEPLSLSQVAWGLLGRTSFQLRSLWLKPNTRAPAFLLKARAPQHLLTTLDVSGISPKLIPHFCLPKKLRSGVGRPQARRTAAQHAAPRELGCAGLGGRSQASRSRVHGAAGVCGHGLNCCRKSFQVTL